MIELRNITKSYRLDNGERRYVFRDLNFTFPDGANIGLIGRNGAGKSTLLRIIGGIDTPDRGRVITDQNISWPVGSTLVQGTLTGRDIVKFACRIYGTTHEEMREKVRFVEEFAELGEYFDQPIRFYSSGMRSRINLGTSLAFEFDYYLMDEVGAAGDAAFKAKSRKILQERIEQAHVIVVSHSMSEIARLCNVVVLVQDGQAYLFEDVKEGIDAYQSMAKDIKWDAGSRTGDKKNTDTDTDMDAKEKQLTRQMRLEKRQERLDRRQQLSNE